MSDLLLIEKRVGELERTVWTLHCALTAAREIIPPSNPVGVVLTAVNEHTRPVVLSTLPGAT